MNIVLKTYEKYIYHFNADNNLLCVLLFLILSITIILLLPKFLKYCLDKKELNNKFTIKNENEKNELLVAKKNYEEKLKAISDSVKTQEKKEAILKYLINESKEDDKKDYLQKLETLYFPEEENKKTKQS